MELNQTSSPAPKPKFNLWLITTIVLAVFLVAGGVVFAWQKSTSDKVKTDLQGQINILQNQIQQLTTIPADETADWKTYTNTNYGFEIKYPETWSISEKNNIINLINHSETSQKIEILISSGPPPETIRDKIIRTEEVIVDGIKATKEIFQGKFEDNKDDYYVRVFVAEKDVFYQTDFDDTDQIMPIFDQILSTFKFTK